MTNVHNNFIVSGNNWTGVGSAYISNVPTVKPNGLTQISGLYAYAGSPASTLILDASTFSNMTSASVCNTGSDTIYLGTSGMTFTSYFKSLTDGETWEYPLAYTSTSGNDIYALRKTVQTGSTIYVMYWSEA